MQNAAIGVLGLDAVYVALRTSAQELTTVLAALAAVGGAGNVTVPHKEAAERYVARKTDVCARVGACNTFWMEHGALVGDNTDVAGILAALRQLGADGAGSWLLLGTGGSARAEPPVPSSSQLPAPSAPSWRRAARIPATSVLSPTSAPCSIQNVLQAPTRAHSSVFRATHRSAASLCGTVTLPAPPAAASVASAPATAGAGVRSATYTASSPNTRR